MIGAGVRFVATLAIAFVLAFSVRVLAFEPFAIPSDSMEPALTPGDYVLAEKWAYGYSRASFNPFDGPSWSGRVLAQTPAPGDVVVFRNRKDRGRDYIKRVVAGPGDRVQLKAGAVYVNGAAFGYAIEDVMAGADAYGAPTEVHTWREQAVDGRRQWRVRHVQRASGERIGNDDTPEYVVPAGYVFVLGDNRDASVDSRSAATVGYVPIDDIIGRVRHVFVSAEAGFRLWNPRTWALWRSERMFVRLDPR